MNEKLPPEFPVIVMVEPPKLQKVPALIHALREAYGTELELISDKHDDYPNSYMIFGIHVPKDMQ